VLFWWSGGGSAADADSDLVRLKRTRHDATDLWPDPT
jgi:hypothetical protein